MKTKNWLNLSIHEQSKILSKKGYIVTTNGEIFKCLKY